MLMGLITMAAILESGDINQSWGKITHFGIQKKCTAGVTKGLELFLHSNIKKKNIESLLSLNLSPRLSDSPKPVTLEEHKSKL